MLLSFLSGLADITIILPLIEDCAGYDFITGEELTGFESGMKIVFAVVDVATLGMALGATGVLEAGVSLTAKEGALLLGKTVVIETASNIAGYTTGFMANETDLPAFFTSLETHLSRMCMLYEKASEYISNTYRIHIKQPMNMLSPLEKINTLILDCNNVLSSAGMNGISYTI